MGIAQRREGFLNRLTALGIAPRVVRHRTRGAMPTRLNELTRVFRDQNSSRRWASPPSSVWEQKVGRSEP
ncbi:hypothetical protein LF1_37770 [Rubripirellula obstinata]|uniref:Uncharacterized protein n=1 Tax=Rubripirellula obstinata TaxID=406547 RepID=A0A5B1CLS2_9BACT|nr:hypothetical protein LF1_37770 [Rubripirellula obstinata]